MHNTWNQFFTDEINKELDNIFEKIGDNYYPKKENVLRFTNNDLNNVKYIIVGMEPYPSSTIVNNEVVPEATGRSFEVTSLYDKTWSSKFKQSSLRNILKTIYYNEKNIIKPLDAIREEIDTGIFEISNPTEWFDNMEQQGVLFLNATLTVIPNQVDSHTKIWENFMNKLIKYIDEQNPDIKWLLWGNKAQERILKIIESDKTICAVHPRLPDFVTENCFKKATNVKWTGK